jgi:hypothetical protein
MCCCCDVRFYEHISTARPEQWTVRHNRSRTLPHEINPC